MLSRVICQGERSSLATLIAGAEETAVAAMSATKDPMYILMCAFQVIKDSTARIDESRILK